MIRFSHVSKHYDGVAVIHDLNFTAEAGEVLVLLGGSGSGKTTTLRMINRLSEPSSGSIEVAGQPIQGLPGHVLRRQIGYVFQQVGLFPHMTLAENIAITPRLLGWDRARIQQRVDDLLRQIELSPEQHRERFPGQLSGGQRQRVGVARALAAEPQVLLLDEPFGALDALTRSRLQQFFKVLQQRLRFTAIFVTHDVAEALLLADRIAVMHEGRIQQLDKPMALLREPATDYVAELMATPRGQAEFISQLLAAAPDKPQGPDTGVPDR